VPPIKEERLFEQAEALLDRHQQGPGRPRDTNLRRAVSTAYYALFHGLTSSVSEWLAPLQPNNARQSLRRALGHNGMKQVCVSVTRPDTGSKFEYVKLLAAKAAVSQDVVDIAQAFIDLQQARHSADYDHAAPFSKSMALALVDEVGDAVALLQPAAGTSEFEAFAILLVLQGGGR